MSIWDGSTLRPSDSRAARLEPEEAAEVDAADAPAMGVDVISKAAGLSQFTAHSSFGGFEICVDCGVALWNSSRGRKNWELGVTV